MRRLIYELKNTSAIYDKWMHIKHFFINCWKYRKELSFIYHVDYKDELFSLMNRYTQEFSKNIWVLEGRPGERKDKKRFKVVKWLMNEITNNDIKFINNKKLHHTYFSTLFKYIEKYSGRWWV